MASLTSSLPPAIPNRRKRVRHKVQTPAYASFSPETKGAMLDLHEIVDISEEGMAIQCTSPFDAEAHLNLCLDLADCPEHIYTTGLIVWSNESGRHGVRFSELPAESLARLREWLFVNVMAGVANGEAEVAGFVGSREAEPPHASYTDALAAVTAVQSQVEALGSDLAAALRLITERAQVLVRASGAAIALAEKDPEFMVCRATSGKDAPPIGARLHVGSGFSGECVKSGMLLRCDDAEVDARVDAESCRALGLRSIVAAPVRVNGKSIGLIEAFSSEPKAFTEVDGRVLQRLASTVLAAVNRAARAEDLPAVGAQTATKFSAPQGSVLFASAEKKEEEKLASEEKRQGDEGISLPRSQLIILICAAATIASLLGFYSAPMLQADLLPWIQDKFHPREHVQIPTVLASTQPANAPPDPSVETANLDQLRQMAEKGDPIAQNAIGLRYAMGDGVRLNEAEAVRWFTKAAELGNVPAQSKLGTIYFSGRGVPQDYNRAYFWMVVARLSGDDASKTLAPFVRARLTRAQVTSIELDADRWLQQHRGSEKPPAGQLKAKN
ncbi:MAG TPA: GAF domain-containing protein [Candidatus Sulfotelmatobacter sp.]|nr:GAF domain-containing protein [Candidatus Sulfotelmatobacter sp.]